MMLVNQGTIIASGINSLNIDTGLNTIVNSGMLEASGSGGLVIDSNLDNPGVLWANGANITLHGSVTGTGTALMDGTATLEFSGVVSGFNEDDHFDLAGCCFCGGHKRDLCRKPGRHRRNALGHRRDRGSPNRPHRAAWAVLG
jgi:hypothetical protein